ncbi:(DL)-glycerol-3-phosphatase 2 [Psilocybe cubensis]|uniref:(DL)-glycerol-3-phosphatase 2 n=2 Tax=Psilocybe cubensis TaxID=181762 RepID=A0ACB8HCU8_PSICU|nr:(DL)-glycerol-3-phosphatase 2 [Psilocybe cubensis]KAH9485537.1 (DL)-glycerol-3-phosphatase 2 [Psilocybe cubensis]
MSGPLLQRRNVEYVLFDMDGLMIDSEKIYTIATNEVLGKFGKEMTWDMKAGCMGKPEREAAIHTLSFFPGIPITVDEFLVERNRVQDTLYHTVSLLPGISKLVHHLKKHNIPMAVATSSRRRNFEMKTALHQEFFSLFDGKIVCGDDRQYNMKGKPAPDIFLVAATVLGKNVGKLDEVPEAIHLVERAKGLVFEDALPGIQAGKSAGMSVVWVPDPNLLKLTHQTEEVPDQVLASLEDFKPEEWGLPPYDS